MLIIITLLNCKTMLQYKILHNNYTIYFYCKHEHHNLEYFKPKHLFKIWGEKINRKLRILILQN